ncbi:murein L,D-transpeptidase [Methylovirgula sp. 4M-Z18]|nr:murein L,D-transpeptidase [Methylovirgula sp. 4M-Z18]
MKIHSRVSAYPFVLALLLSAPALAQTPDLLSPNPVSSGLTPAAPQPVPTTAPLPRSMPVKIPEGAKAAEAPAAGAAQAAPKPKPKPAPPSETVLSTDPMPTLMPETFFATAKASDRYAAIADSGGWPVVDELAPGASGKAVAVLRKRLAIEGDLPANQGTGETWTPDLTAAVKRFQSRMGLRQTGVVAGATLKAMNVPAVVRFKELASSAQRLAGTNFDLGNRYVVVNIPSTSVEAVENGRVAHRYVAVVGGVDHPSPEVATHITAINLNPTWTVPVSIIKNEIIPKMQKNPHYLAKQKIRILGANGEEVNPAAIDWSTTRATAYTLRQDSGAGNSLGSIRINMPNKNAVYMHDTPSKRLFAADYRFLSHGCVRVQGVYDLAEWLLQGTVDSISGIGWDKQELLAEIAKGDRTDIKLSQPVPVAWVYLTGWANSDDIVHFRDDVYGIDTVPVAVQARTEAPPTKQ